MAKIEEEPPHRILLVADAWNNLAEMPQLIREAGYLSDILCPEGNIARYSSFVSQWIDSGKSRESLFKSLIDLDKSGLYSYILIGEDPLLWQIYFQPIGELTHLLPILEPGTRPMMGKINFARLCNQLGISTPEFAVIKSIEDIDAAVVLLGFPLVTKVSYSSAGLGVNIFRDRGVLQAYVDAHNFAHPLMAQKWIDGELLSVEALFCNGRALEYACSVALEATLGPSTKRRYMPRIPEVGAVLEKLGQFTKLHGFANITFIRELPSGSLYLIEADPRPNKWVPYAHWFGANFAQAFRLFINNDHLSPAPLLDLLAESKVTHWDIEHFETHLIKLLESGDTLKSVLHLLDFDNNLRYIPHDPGLLREKTLRLKKRLR
ncbi:ATP-grasp domain-containing protein [Polynucleobacter paneuropaeus]|nr:ATP-grasp domain-containing protein [Polynucleobacter paneuropaeus]